MYIWRVALSVSPVVTKFSLAPFSIGWQPASTANLIYFWTSIVMIFEQPLGSIFPQSHRGLFNQIHLQLWQECDHPHSRYHLVCNRCCLSVIYDYFRELNLFRIPYRLPIALSSKISWPLIWCKVMATIYCPLVWWFLVPRRLWLQFG